MPFIVDVYSIKLMLKDKQTIRANVLVHEGIEPLPTVDQYMCNNLVAHLGYKKIMAYRHMCNNETANSSSCISIVRCATTSTNEMPQGYASLETGRRMVIHCSKII